MAETTARSGKNNPVTGAGLTVFEGAVDGYTLGSKGQGRVFGRYGEGSQHRG